VAVTSDHGEALGERGIWFNHLLCYPEVLRVPLALRFPGVAPSAVPARASTLDLAPTLIEELGLGASSALPGANLLDLAAGRVPGDRRVHFVHSALLQAGCRGDREHYVRTLRPWDQLGPDRLLPEGHEVLFDPREDPGLERDLAAAGGARVEELRAAVARWLEASSTGTRVQAAISEDEEARLQALGYGGAEVSPGAGEH
jgi:arylsulfatase A-like enzyme